MKKPYFKTTVRGVSALALLALSLWFGLLPYYRLAALLVAALILPVLLRPEWTFSIVTKDSSFANGSPGPAIAMTFSSGIFSLTTLLIPRMPVHSFTIFEKGKNFFG